MGVAYNFTTPKAPKNVLELPNQLVKTALKYFAIKIPIRSGE